MPAHRVRKRALEEIVVAAGQLLQRDGQILALRGPRELGQAAHVGALGSSRVSNGHDGPVRHDGEPVRGSRRPARALGKLALRRSRAAAGGRARRNRPRWCVFGRRLVGQEAVGPDLAVRMRVRAAHHRALVLEDLHPRVGRAPSSALCSHQVSMTCSIAGSGQLGQAPAVIGRKADRPGWCRARCRARTAGRSPAAHPARRLGQRREVVGEDEGPRVIGIAFAGDAQVAGAQVAVGIVRRRSRAVRRLPAGPARGAWRGAAKPAPRTGQRVEAAMRVVSGIEHGVSPVGCRCRALWAVDRGVDERARTTTRRERRNERRDPDTRAKGARSRSGSTAASSGPLPAIYLVVENRYTEVCEYVSPGRRTVLGNSGRLGESGKCCGSRQRLL